MLYTLCYNKSYSDVWGKKVQPVLLCKLIWLMKGFKLVLRSMRLFCIHTHIVGLFQYILQPSEVSPTSAVLWKIMSRLTVRVPDVAVYLDGILVSIENLTEHMEMFCRVFISLLKFWCKREKCFFAILFVNHLVIIGDLKTINRI